MIKVLHILNEIKHSGAEIMLKTAAPFFVDNKIELYALSTGSKVGEYSTILEECGYNVNHIKFEKKIDFFVRLFDFINKNNFDIVHIHTERSFFWYALIARLAGVKKIIRTIHSIFIFNGLLRIRKKLQRYVSRRLFNLIFISIGESVKTIEKEYYNNNTKVIKNWISTIEFSPESNKSKRQEMRCKFGISANTFVIVSAGQCTFVKQHDHVIMALAELSAKDMAVKYIHLGDGKLLAEEKFLARKLGVENKILFMGNVKNVREYLVISDVFIMPSKYEGLGNAALEAMSCGIPVIAYNTYGLKDIITNNVTGLLVDSNPGALEKGIEEIILMDRIEMSNQAINFVYKHHSLKLAVKDLLNLYRN